ncbi:hypothetical protein HDU97_010406 [Phlyctochytrium planicorne]|nr:hypothetical protein HDU97_010406 [Phlyctochytrium planicorne]
MVNSASNPPSSSPPPGQSSNNGQAPEEKRVSMLDVVRDTLQRQGKTSMLYRAILCGELKNPTERTELGGHYQKFFKLYQSDADLITGMLLALPGTWVHVLECSQRVMLAFLRELGNLRTENGHKCIKSAKILLMSDDITQRFFPFWASRVIDQSSTPFYLDDTMYTEETFPKTLADICVNVCTIGSGLSNLSKNDLKNVLEELSERFQKQIPRSETIEFISRSNDVISIEEWLTVFDERINTPKDSELVWPAPKSIKI